MAIAQLTAADYAQRISDAILARNSKYETNFGPVADLLVYPLAPILEGINSDTRKVESLLSLLNNGDYTHEDLVNFIANEGLKPDIGGIATVTLVFATSRVNEDVPLAAGFPVGIQTTESTSQPVIFVTTTSATLPYAQRASYYNANTKKYELQVQARCTVPGSVGRISKNRLIKPLRPLVGFESVTNPSATDGGRDAATDAELIEQYLIAITGTDEGTVHGTQRVVRDVYPSVIDSMVTYGNDATLTRASSDAGATDLWVIGQTATPRTDVATFLGVLKLIPLVRQPVLSVDKVFSGSTIFVEGTDYDVVFDTSGYAGSVRARDAIVFRASGAHPNLGDSLTIQYNQNALIENIQTTYNSSDHMIIGRDLLARAATQLDAAISLDMAVRPGFNFVALRTMVSNTILKFVNATQLSARIPGASGGGSLQRSDIDAEIRRISGIDNITFTLFDLVGGTSVADIPVAANFYIRISADNIRINIV